MIRSAWLALTLAGCIGDAESADITPAQEPDTVFVSLEGPHAFRATFHLHDVDGFALLDNDLVALQTREGGWLRESDGAITADATHPEITATSSSLFYLHGPTNAPIVDGSFVTLQAAGSGRYLADDIVGLQTTSLQLSCVFTFRRSLSHVHAN
jgi:hypothetical protein